jgi:hypothetical protein
MALVFNSIPFLTPNTSAVSRDINITEWRSVNGSLVRQVIGSGKTIYTATFQKLTQAQFTTLRGYAEGINIPVSSTVTNHTFSFASASVTISKYPTEGFGGFYENTEIKIKEV